MGKATQGDSIRHGRRLARGVLTGIVALAAVAIGVVLSPGGASAASAHAHAPEAPARALATCGWFNDISQSRQYTGINVAGKPTTATFNAQVLSYRSASTGAYCGQIQEHVCVTISSNFGWPTLAIEHSWYRNGLLINGKRQSFVVDHLGPFLLI